MKQKLNTLTKWLTTGPAVFIAVATGLIAAAWVTADDPRWWFETETVVVEKTITHSPWYMDAVTPILLLFILWIIVWGLQGGFPRP